MPSPRNTKTHISVLFLALGFLFLFFTNGRWILPLAPYLSAFFLIRHCRFQHPLRGFVHLVIAGLVSNIFIWKGMMPISGPFYYVLMLMMSIFHSLIYLIDRILSRRLSGFIATLVFPAAYVVMEYITVSTNPSGSYGMLGHTQTFLPLLQLTAITGIYGVSFVVMWTASVANWLCDREFTPASRSRVLRFYAIPAVVIILLGQVRLLGPADEPTVRVATVSIPRDELQRIYAAESGEVGHAQAEAFLDNCRKAAIAGARIVFGTEGIVHVGAAGAEDVLQRAQAIAAEGGIYLGLPMFVHQDDRGMLPRNQITWISPGGDVLFEFTKARPTPGEGSYGDGVIRFFDSPYGRVGSVICFDMDFPTVMHQAAGMNIDIMAVPGNDWREISPYHTHVASFRAVELGFNLVRAASWGLSGSFDTCGRLLASSDYFVSDQAIFFSDVPVEGTGTVYGAVGDLFAWLCVLVFILTGVRGWFWRSAGGNE